MSISQTAANGLAAPTVSPSRKNDIFISYSRRNIEFVRALDEALRKAGRDPWVDWDDIKKAEDWWKAIQDGIEGAHTFVFVISPDSAASTVCGQEVEHAVKHNKRIIPILHRDCTDMSKLHPEIGKQNWIFFRETNNFDQSFQELITAINTDLEYVRAHTRFLMRGLEWEGEAHDDSLLLRDSELVEAERFFSEGATKEPKPTVMHQQYIHISRMVQDARVKAQQNAKRLIIISAVLANAIIGVSAFFVVRVAKEEALRLVRNEMVETLEGAISGVNGNEFERLANITGPNTNHPLYQQHQAWLDTIHQIAPRAYPYTFVKGAQPYEVLWIGDVYREARPSSATAFRESFIADPAETMLYNGLTELTVRVQPYTDQWGRWVSIYAPIKNAQGNVVGGMGIDFDASYATNVERTVQYALMLAYFITFICLLVLGIAIFRITSKLTRSPISGKEILKSIQAEAKAIAAAEAEATKAVETAAKTDASEAESSNAESSSAESEETATITPAETNGAIAADSANGTGATVATN